MFTNLRMRPTFEVVLLLAAFPSVLDARRSHEDQLVGIASIVRPSGPWTSRDTVRFSQSHSRVITNGWI